MDKDLKATLLEEKKQLELKLKLSQLVAGILLKGKHSVGKINENSSSLEYHTLEILISKLLDDDEVINELVSNDFCFISRVSDTRKIFDAKGIDSTSLNHELEELRSNTIDIALQYEQINGSIRYAYKENFHNDSCCNHIIDLLLIYRDYEMLQKLFLSDKISIETKKAMYEKCFNLDKKETAEIFRKLHYKNKIFKSEDLQKKLSAVFKEIMEFRSAENISELRRLLSCRYSNYGEEHEAMQSIKFLIEACNVDPNSIDFFMFPSSRERYGLKKDEDAYATAAAQAYRFKNFDIGNYLYSLYDLKTIDSEKRKNSDIIIMSEICEKYAPCALISFIREKNFEYTSKNFACIMNILMHKQLENKMYIDENEKEQIIALFLERAKKEDLEEIKLLVEQFLNVTDKEVIKASRQAVVACLRKDLEVLLAEVPGKMSVGDAHARRFRHPIEK